MENEDKLFFDYIRNTLFGGKLSQNQVDSINTILCECINSEVTDSRYISYILATAYHEVGAKLIPVREGFCKTNQCAITHVTRLYNRGKISVNYALPKKNGNSYYGRGYVQLTWDYNYKKAGDALSIKLYDNPDLALHEPIAAKILVMGMVQGWFTKYKISDFFNEETTDWVNARKIINGTDKAKKIGDYAVKFYKALTL